MDPDSKLKELVELAKAVQKGDPNNIVNVDQMAALVLELDKWMSEGNISPKKWRG